jgi:hypothetical protein
LVVFFLFEEAEAGALDGLRTLAVGTALDAGWWLVCGLAGREGEGEAEVPIAEGGHFGGCCGGEVWFQFTRSVRLFGGRNFEG